MRAHRLLRKALVDARLQVAGYGLALFAMAVLIVLIWPSYKDSLAVIDIPEALEALLGSDLPISTAAGFLSAEYFSWIPILLIVFAITQGTGAIAGEEGSGTIDILLAQPITRTDMVLARTLAFVLGSVAIVAFGFVGFVVTVPLIDIDVTLGDVFVACANMLPIAFVFYALSLWLGAVAPTRGVAVGAVIAIVTATYFCNAIGSTVDALDWLVYASPFHYYGAGLPLVRGIDWFDAGLLLALAAVFFLVALGTFDRRDVTIGGASELRLRTIARRVTMGRAN